MPDRAVPDNDVYGDELAAMIREASFRISDPNTWSAAERQEAIEAGWLRPIPTKSDGCNCGGIGDTGAHRGGCPWNQLAGR